jgi:hypothetical protein
MAEQPFITINSTQFKILVPFFKVTKVRSLDAINTVILHWTAGSSVGSDFKTLQNKGYGYHFLIDKEGNIFQGGPLNGTLSHAGDSYGPNGSYTNATSIGISFSTRGDEKKEVGSTKFNKAQIEAAINIIADIKNTLPNLKYISGHQWVSPGRKIDPWTFPFDELMTTTYGGILGLFTKTLKGEGFELWKTGYKPFPSGLSDCKCIEEYPDGNCKKSTGDCIGPGKYGYSERKLSTEVSDSSFQSDLDSA